MSRVRKQNHASNVASRYYFMTISVPEGTEE